MANNYWLRSPNLGNTSNFWNVNANGGLNNNNANNVNGLVPGFSFAAVTYGRKCKNERRRRT